MSCRSGQVCHVYTCETDAFFPCFRVNVHPAMLRNREIKLRSLEVLRQIRIVVVLSVKLAVTINFAICCKPRLDGVVYHLTIDDGQDTGKSEADGTDVRILICAEACGTAAENLGLCLEFAVNLKADDGFVFHALPPIGAIFVWKSCPCS